MDIRQLFAKDDGSLPEIEVKFEDATRIAEAFALLFEFGARDVTGGGGRLWLDASQSERTFSGPADAALVVSGSVRGFHVVLADITLAGAVIPELGVLVFPGSLTIDYRMGPQWGDAEIHSLVALLARLRLIGGTISVPWWGAAGEQTLNAALAAADNHRDGAVHADR